jgi:hypothetical protein
LGLEELELASGHRVAGLPAAWRRGHWTIIF